MQDSCSAEHNIYVFKSENGTKVIHILHKILHTCHSSGFHSKAQFQNYFHDERKKEDMSIIQKLFQITYNIQPEISCLHRSVHQWTLSWTH